MKNKTELHAIKELGISGRMITGSKSGYSKTYPGNAAIFNANIFAISGDSYEKVWHGDLDLTLDSEKLLKISETLGKEIVVLREMDGRFDNEEEPILENAVASYDSNREIPVRLGTESEPYYTVDGIVIKYKN